MIAILTAAALAANIPTPAQQAIIKNAFEDVLVDAKSARFRWPEFIGTVTYCGWINAKNSFGAYTGWKQYFIFVRTRNDNKKFFVDGKPLIADGTAHGETATDMCIYNGYSPLQKISELPES